MSKTISNDDARDGFRTCGFDRFAADNERLAELVDWYVAVFNARGAGEWGEHWTPETAREKILADVASEAGRTLITTWRAQGALAGVSLVFVDRAADVLKVKDLPPACRDAAVLSSVRAKLSRLLGAATVVAQYRELGIRREFRSGLDPVARLMLDPGLASMEMGAEYVCYWTSKHSRLYPIVLGLSMVPVHDFGDRDGDVLMVGDCAWLSRCLRFPRPLLKAVIALRLAWLKISGRYRITDGCREGSHP